MVSNKEAKFIKSLKIKKYRVLEKSFIIEGSKNVLEAIHSGFQLSHLLVTPGFLSKNVLPLSNVRNILQEVQPNTLTSLGTFKTNNECLAVAKMKTNHLEDIQFDASIVALDGVNDPGNLGTIIRTMDWFGFSHLVCSEDTTDLYNPKVINSTMGSFSRVNVIYTDLGKFLSNCPLQSFGADLEGSNLHNWNPGGPVVLVMGSESHGISSEVRKRLHAKISIAGYGNAESLNVAIATGIICYHLKSLNL